MEILPSEIFEVVEENWKSMYDHLLLEEKITAEELESKVHNTFVHDKLVFDTLNRAIYSSLQAFPSIRKI